MLNLSLAYLSKEWILVAEQPCTDNESRIEAIGHNTIGIAVRFKTALEFASEENIAKLERRDELAPLSWSVL